MRILTILILGLFLSFGCGGGDEEPAPSPNPQEPAPSPNPQEPVPSPNPQEPVPSPNPQEPVPSPNPQEPIPPPDPDGEHSGANIIGDITDSADISILDRSHTDLIGGDSDRVDYYRFSLTEDREVELRLRTVHEQETNTDLILEDADGVVIDGFTETQSVIVLEEALQAGTYYVRVEDESQEVSLYLLTYNVSVSDSDGSMPDSDGFRESANHLGDITDIADTAILDRSHTGLIGGDSDRVDYYRFSLTEEREVDLRLSTIHEQETNTDLILEDSDGKVIDSVTEPQTGVIVLKRILQAGTYYVRIEDESQEVSLYLFIYYEVSVPGS